MSDLTAKEKRAFEKFLGMSSGYVADFSNRTFEEFVLDTVSKEIYDSKYDYASGSKANRLRAFWNVEPNHVVGMLLAALVEYCGEEIAEVDEPLRDECYRISQRLKQSAPVADLDAISSNAAGKDFESLAKAVAGAIDRNEPEAGLDRLHTFVVKYVRVLSEQRGIDVKRDKPLHSLFGEYIKQLDNDGLVKSEMTRRILKSSISTLESFNRVRNEQSFAHDNPILDYDESLLIFNHVASAIRFIQSIERRAATPPEETGTFGFDDDIPF